LPVSVRLSWDSSSCVIAPLSICPVARPLPDDIAAIVRPAAAKRPTRSAHVVSHHLDGLLRAQASGLLHPETEWSFAAFPGCAPIIHRPKPTTDGRRLPFPATRFTPSEEFHSPIAVPHHCGRYPPAVLSRRVRPSAEALVRPLRVPTGRRHRHLSHSRGCLSVSAAPSLRSPSLATPAVETAGRARCTVLPAPPKGPWPVDSIDAEAPTVKPVSTDGEAAMSQGFPAQCRVSPLRRL